MKDTMLILHFIGLAIVIGLGVREKQNLQRARYWLEGALELASPLAVIASIDERIKVARPDENGVALIDIDKCDSDFFYGRFGDLGRLVSVGFAVGLTILIHGKGERLPDGTWG